MAKSRLSTRRPRGWLGVSTAAAFAALLALAGLVAVDLLTAAGGPAAEAVRLRNSLIVGRVSAERLGWAPPEWPDDFLLESRPAPAELVAAVASIPELASPDATTLDRAIAIARYLRPHAKPKGIPISATTSESLRAIRERGVGHCSDYTQVFVGLAHAAGIPVREWGVSLDGSRTEGHAFVEVWDPVARSWIHLDPFWGLYAADPLTQEPESVLELRERILGADADGRAEFVFFLEEEKRVGDLHTHREYYRRGFPELYLWWGNAVFTAEQHPLVSASARIARPLEQITAIALGLHPEMRVLVTPENEPLVRELERLAWRVRAGAVVALASGIWLVVQLVRLVRLRGRGRRRG